MDGGAVRTDFLRRFLLSLLRGVGAGSLCGIRTAGVAAVPVAFAETDGGRDRNTLRRDCVPALHDRRAKVLSRILVAGFAFDDTERIHGSVPLGAAGGCGGGSGAGVAA